VLSTYRVRQLVRVLPHAALLTLMEATFALLLGRWSQAADVLGAWTWNARRAGEILDRRRQVREFRQVSDLRIRKLQSRGSARLHAFLRGHIGRDDDRLNAVRASFADLAADLRSPTRRIPMVATGAVMLLLVVGSRGLITSPVPAIGEFTAFPSRPGPLLDAWFSGWRSAGLGSEAPAPTGFGVLGLLGVLLPGSMAALRQVLILGLLPLGVLGAWRMARPLGSVRAGVAASVVYVAVPVPYNALANGSWSGLVLYASSPWLLLTLARATRLAPYGPVGGDVLTARRGRPPVVPPPQPDRSIIRQVLVLGLVLGLAATLAPVVVAVTMLVAVALAAGSVVAFRVHGSGRLLATSLGGAAVAVVLHTPWSLDLLRPGSDWSAIAGMGAREGGLLSVGQLLRFESGPLGAAPIGWAFLVAGALPLLVGRKWRLEWAVRAWFVALACWSVLWAGEEGWLPFRLPPPELLLAPAAAGLALATALGLTAFEVDLSGYRFGWRQLVSLAAAVAVFAGAVPLLGGVLDGRWQMPATDIDASLATAEPAGDQAFRVLWIGEAEAMPLAAWTFDDRLAYATSEHLRPGVQDLWAGSPRGATRRLTEALETATERGSTRLGRLIGPMGVRYVVVPLARAGDGGRRPPPPELSGVLAEQLDLERIEFDPGVVLYRNTAWMPYGAAVDDGVDREGAPSAAGVDLSGAEPVLTTRDGHAVAGGRAERAGPVLTASAASPNWELEVDGRRAERRTAWGWANEFEVARAGTARLRYATPVTRPLWLALQAMLWIAALVALTRIRRRARAPIEAP
jgi:hypothetical protein